MNQTTLLSSTCLVSWLVSFFAVAAASSQTLALTGVRPASGAPGDPVELRGRGFDHRAASYFAWSSDGERGFVLDVTGKSSRARLSAVVADLHADVEGPVVLWQGRRSPVRPFKIGNGRFTVRDAFVFHPTETARGPSFTASAGSTSGFAGRLVDGAIHLDLAPPPSVTTASLRLAEGDDEDDGEAIAAIGTITVEGAGESCGPPNGGGGGEEEGGNGNNGFTLGSGFGFRIECGGPRPCRGKPAALLAAAFNRLAIDGVEATALGSTVVLSRSRPLCGAALNATLSPPLARAGSQLIEGSEALLAQQHEDFLPADGGFPSPTAPYPVSAR